MTYMKLKKYELLQKCMLLSLILLRFFLLVLSLLLLLLLLLLSLWSLLLLLLPPLLSLLHLLSFVLWLLKISFLRFRSSHWEVLWNIFSWNKRWTSNKRQNLIHLNVARVCIRLRYQLNYQRKLGFFMPLLVGMFQSFRMNFENIYHICWLERVLE